MFSPDNGGKYHRNVVSNKLVLLNSFRLLILYNYYHIHRYECNQLNNNLLRPATYQPKLKHDLESFIRTIMFLYFELQLPHTISEGDPQTLAKKSIAFWSEVDEEIKKSLSEENKKYWQETLNITRTDGITDRMNALKEQLSKLQLNFLNIKNICSRFEKKFPV